MITKAKNKSRLTINWSVKRTITRLQSKWAILKINDKIMIRNQFERELTLQLIERKRPFANPLEAIDWFYPCF